MQYDQQEVAKTQIAALKVFKYFKTLCKKNKLTYYAIGGTCIGAIRHKGFIPWDDDIDVAMPVEDYYRFIDICKTELELPYAIISPNTVKHYVSMYIKLQDSSTTFVEDFAEKYPDRYAGIYMDVFPIYGLPKDDKEREKLIRKNEQYKKINLKLRFPLSDEYGSKGKAIWLLLSPLRASVPFYWATEKQQGFFRNIPFDSSEKVYFPWRAIPGSKGSGNYKNVFFYEDFKTTIEMPFEDTFISVPTGYDRYLSMDFGNYMTLPPKEKQIPGHPKAIIDFDTPYVEYLNKEISK